MSRKKIKVLLLFGSLLSARLMLQAEEKTKVTKLLIKGGCGACHVIPGVPNAIGKIGPDLSKIGLIAQNRIKEEGYTGKAKNAREYIEESLVNPTVYISKDCPGGPCQPTMPPVTAVLSKDEIKAIVDYLMQLKGQKIESSDVKVDMVVPKLTAEEMEKAKKIFFDRCAGCHGVLRKGATGPALTPDKTVPKGTFALKAIIFNGTPGGMPDWGRQGILNEEETELMAKFIQNEPPAPPQMSLEKMMEHWKVIVPVEQRPTKPMHDRNWRNFFSVTLRDIGKVAIIDGDKKDVISIVETGYAVHISRMSATGRYVYTIGRDGKATLIDLWSNPPKKVAEVKTCYDARSIDVSKYKGKLGNYYDRYAVIGCYWPPHFVILDGLTLKPLKIVSTLGYTYDTEEFHPEPRVASIVASHHKPQWVINVKETGQVWLVDYRKPNNPTIRMLEAERFLHDGGWESKKRYFLVAANMRNKVVIVDTQEEEVEAIVETGVKPHPGRGANWIDPKYGRVWATSHLGEGSIALIGSDPEKHPEYAWKVVKKIVLPSSGSLFLKTHPKSQWVWVDFALSSDPKWQKSVCVIKKATAEVFKCWEVATYGRAVHIEYDMSGTEVWVSVWGRKGNPGKEGEIVIYDDTTLKEVKRIKRGMVTPTGKFNVYNTMMDLY